MRRRSVLVGAGDDVVCAGARDNIVCGAVRRHATEVAHSDITARSRRGAAQMYDADVINFGEDRDHFETLESRNFFQVSGHVSV